MSTREGFLKHFPDFVWNLTPEEILQRTEEAISKAKELHESVLKIDKDKISFSTVVEPLALGDSVYMKTRNMLDFYHQVSTDKNVRDASTESSKKFAQFEVELNMRRDIYDVLNETMKRETALKGEAARYLNKVLLMKKRSGLHLSLETRTQIEQLDKKINELCVDFSKNIGEENTSFELDAKDLNGMSEDFMAGLDKKGDKYVVTLKYPHSIPILKMCKVVSTRRLIEKAFNSRCIKENVPILEQVLQLRKERANLLGYPTHADYKLEILMSKNSKTVETFLVSLAEKLKSSGKRELTRLLELKQQECHELGIEFDGKINAYDNSYYQKKVEEMDFSVDQNLIREYFPFEHVNDTLLEIYQTLLHLKFEKVQGSPTWHPEVSHYAVYDKKNNDALLGYFYLDLFPRPGKFSHAACFPLQDACENPQGNQLPLAAMVANFTKPLQDKPSLLTHEEVETYFHEFGHAMHHICSKSKYSLFTAFGVETDFLEAPSQMLENWVWEEQSLKKISRHYKTGEPMSDELIKKLCKLRFANVSLFYLRQIGLSLTDYTYHTSPDKVDMYQVYKKIMTELSGVEVTPGTNMAASFNHLCGGYDSQYYGYLWSLVYSCDMFQSRFKKEGVLNPFTGLDYRRKILQPGSTKDGSELLRDFLGRDPIQEPFLETIGIK